VQPHPLESCRQKCLRAAKHLEELATVISEYRDAHPYGLRIDTESDPPWRIGRIEIPDAPLTQWGVIVGDFAHNLRSALDHLIYQLAILNGCDPEKMGTQFPIFITEEDYLRVGNRGRRKGKLSSRDSQLWGVSDAHKTIIDGLQPFEADKPEVTALAVLNRMSNRDKHRLVSVSHGAMQNRSVIADPADPANEVEIVPADLDGVCEDDAELFRYIVRPDPNAEVQVGFKADHWYGFAGEPGVIPPLGPPELAALMAEIADIIGLFEPNF
jgi:hypothetical protein